MKIYLYSALLFVSFSAAAQIREVPKPVMEAFALQYPAATNANFKDKIVNVQVHFQQDSAKMIAYYSNKGIWKNTERPWEFNKLENDIKDGFTKSRFADWGVLETAIVYLPGNVEQYRLKVEKSDVQKKYLFFNKQGRLLRESITL
jgi:hypothetical protein